MRRFTCGVLFVHAAGDGAPHDAFHLKRPIRACPPADSYLDAFHLKRPIRAWGRRTWVPRRGTDAEQRIP